MVTKKGKKVIAKIGVGCFVFLACLGCERKNQNFPISDTNTKKVNSLPQNSIVKTTINRELNFFPDGTGRKIECPQGILWNHSFAEDGKERIWCGGIFPDGPSYEFTAEKKLYLQEYYKKGKKEGTVTVWHPNSVVKSTRTYKNDKEDGAFVEYWDNGALYAKGTIKNHFLVGRFERWHKNGRKAEDSVYSDKGDKKLQTTLWDEQGMVILK